MVCALHNLKCTNILSFWLLKRLSDTSEITKAQTHWLPHWRGSPAVKASTAADAGPYVTSRSEGTSAIVPLYPPPHQPQHLLRSLKRVRFTVKVFCFFSLRPFPTCSSSVSYRGSASDSNSDRVAPHLCLLPKHSFF